jgi:hypothetical protein
VEAHKEQLVHKVLQELKVHKERLEKVLKEYRVCKELMEGELLFNNYRKQFKALHLTLQTIYQKV